MLPMMPHNNDHPPLSFRILISLALHAPSLRAFRPLVNRELSLRSLPFLVFVAWLVTFSTLYALSFVYPSLTTIQAVLFFWSPGLAICWFGLRKLWHVPLIVQRRYASAKPLPKLVDDPLSHSVAHRLVPRGATRSLIMSGLMCFFGVYSLLLGYVIATPRPSGPSPTAGTFGTWSLLVGGIVTVAVSILFASATILTARRMRKRRFQKAQACVWCEYVLPHRTPQSPRCPECGLRPPRLSQAGSS